MKILPAIKLSVCLFAYSLLWAVLLLHLSIDQVTAGCEHSELNLSSEVIPKNSIRYRDSRSPAWKANWDQGRKLFRQKKYAQAEKEYELLLLQKKNIAQARWEYVFILMQQKQWRKAETELAVLIARNPHRPDYLLAKAKITLETGDLNIAAAIFDRLYRQQRGMNTCREDLTLILSGYIAVLEKMKKFDTLLPLMEELKILQPPGYTIRKKAATIAMENDGASAIKKQ